MNPNRLAFLTLILALALAACSPGAASLPHTDVAATGGGTTTTNGSSGTTGGSSGSSSGSSVPEPGMLGMMALSLLGIGAARHFARRKR